MQAKIKRAITSLLPVSAKRQGECNNCGACCHLPNRCRFLGARPDGQSYCTIYTVRPPSCRKYPRIPSEFVTADVCGFWFEEERTDKVAALNTESGADDSVCDVPLPWPNATGAVVKTLR